MGMSGMSLLDRASLLERMPAVFAHRGGWGAATQNTLENLRAAAEVGANLEYDIHRTLDGVIVVHHDAAVGARTFLHHQFGGVEIAKTNYADLPRLAGGERIPTAREVLELGKSFGRAQLVETKALGYERQFLDLAADVGVGADQLYMQSFIPDSVRALKQARPDVAAGLLTGSGRGHNPGLKGIETARRIGADYILPNEKFLTEEYIAATRRANLPIVAWSPWKNADAARSAQLLADPRITAIIANQRQEAVDLARQLRPGAAAA
jgi:glycerophosphoryl diester phosphodiesterase